MRQSMRYLIYLLIGVGIYYFSGADENPEVLSGFRKVAPMVIIVLVVLMMIVKYMRSKQEKSNEDD